MYTCVGGGSYKHVDINIPAAIVVRIYVSFHLMHCLVYHDVYCSSSTFMSYSKREKKEENLTLEVESVVEL